MNVNIKNYRVLQVLPHLNSGGLVSGAIEISGALQKSGSSSFVASQGGRREREITREGGKLFLLPLASKNPFIIFLNIFRLSKIIKKNKISIYMLEVERQHGVLILQLKKWAYGLLLLFMEHIL